MLAAVAASALAFALYARMTWPWVALGWVGLVPWLAVLDRAASVRAALAAGLLMSVAFVLAVFGWFAAAIGTYTGAPSPVALVLLLAAAPLLEPQLLVFALARHLARWAAFGFWRATLAGACAYVGSEWALPKLFGDTLGHGLYASAWMRQAADLAGAAGLTFLLVVANECALAGLRGLVAGPGLRRALAPAACVVTLVLGLLGYGALRCHELASDADRGGALTAGIVQADIGQYDRLRAHLGSFEAVRTILDTHFALSTALLGRHELDLLVWPETVYPTTFGTPKSEAGAAFDREIGAFVARTGVPLVFGAYEREDGREFNAAVFLEPAGRGRLAFETYRKASLFPLTERVPVALESEWLRRWLPWLGTWAAGAGARVVTLALPDGRMLHVAPLICYDVLDPRLALGAARRGAELIVTLSNDSWFAEGSGPRLHLVGAAFLSIETRRPQLRATNTGISAVIAPTGEVLDALAVDQRGTLVATVRPEIPVTTLMVVWGDWLGPTALGTSLVLLATAVAGRPRLDEAGRR